MKRPTDDFWNVLDQLDQKLGSISYYELLGVSAQVEIEGIRRAYERQVRVVHPDRHARESDVERKQRLTRIYARIGEAFRTLSHPQRRAEYDRKLGGGQMRYERARTDNGLRPQADPHHPQARSLFEQARALIEQDDKKAARAKLMLARQYQPDSEAIAKAIAECDGAEPAPAPDPTPAPTQAPTQAQAQAPTSDLAEPVPELLLAPTDDAPGESAAWAPAPQSRAHLRVPMGKSIQVRCEAWKNATSVFMQNISRGGMLVRCDEVLAVGSILELTLEAPGGKPIELPAEVVRHTATRTEGERPGMGIRFLLIPEPSQENFEALLRSAGIKAEAQQQPEPEPAPEPAPVEGSPAAVRADAQELIEAGTPRDAIPMLQIAVRNHPDDKALRAMFHLAAGLTARQQGLSAPAHAHFERALRYDCDSPLILRHLRDD
jgi:uncharacterized protein (TIGR02266 family)